MSDMIHGVWTRQEAIDKGYIDNIGFLTWAGLEELRRLNKNNGGCSCYKHSQYACDEPIEEWNDFLFGCCC